MTSNPNTLVSESSVGKELSQGHQAGYTPDVLVLQTSTSWYGTRARSV